MDKRKYDGGDGRGDIDNEAEAVGNAGNGTTSSKNANLEPPAELARMKIGGRWVIGKRIGSGAFGHIYIGKLEQ
jgi:hypothetical protein